MPCNESTQHAWISPQVVNHRASTYLFARKFVACLYMVLFHTRLSFCIQMFGIFIQQQLHCTYTNQVRSLVFDSLNTLLVEVQVSVTTCAFKW
jgi:hypothetical protein